jgi:hypothetical protein
MCAWTEFIRIRTQSYEGFFKNGNEHYVPTEGGELYHDRNNSTGSVSIQQRLHLQSHEITNFTFSAIMEVTIG